MRFNVLATYLALSALTGLTLANPLPYSQGMSSVHARNPTVAAVEEVDFEFHQPTDIGMKPVAQPGQVTSATKLFLIQIAARLHLTVGNPTLKGTPHDDEGKIQYQIKVSHENSKCGKSRICEIEMDLNGKKGTVWNTNLVKSSGGDFFEKGDKILSL